MSHEITFPVSACLIDIRSRKASSECVSFTGVPLAAHAMPSSDQELANYLLNCFELFCFVSLTLLSKRNAISHGDKNQQRKTDLSSPTTSAIFCILKDITCKHHLFCSHPPGTLGNSLSILKKAAGVLAFRLTMKELGSRN